GGANHDFGNDAPADSVWPEADFLTLRRIGPQKSLLAALCLFIDRREKRRPALAPAVRAGIRRGMAQAQRLLHGFQARRRLPPVYVCTTCESLWRTRARGARGVVGGI